ncbi:lipoate--protein ligase [uncultured Intestinimonas sp.]|uniref:lipoate--protein ligase n=1 Tax=uncultured Intestinimonas sp. TaxID=1689265 RepID=UPI0025DDC1DA|nr:lipoate--protein ligase [uncultured Intestinimonas sp.]
MLLISHDCTDPAWNLALDEYLLTHFTEEVLSLWRNGPSVIVGRNQNALEEIDQDFVRARGIAVVRRLTGGGAVFHDLGNVNYTLVQPYQEGDFNNYAKFTRPIVDFLAELGVRAELSGRNDLLVEGRKCSGNAQAVRGGRILHHGTLLFSADLSQLAGALRPRDIKIQSKGVKSVSSRVTNLAGHLPEPMRVEAFLDRLRAWFLARPGVRPYQLTAEDRAAVDALRAAKYGAWAWNFGASPRYTWARAAKYPFGLVDVRLRVEGGVIQEAVLYGDYFGRRDSGELAAALAGLPHRREAVGEPLRALPLGDYIAGMEPEELLDLLCG